MAFQNLLIVLLVVGGLATVCRIGYLVAAGLLDGDPLQSAAVEEPERLAA
jgi:hypothetical protein